MANAEDEEGKEDVTGIEAALRPYYDMPPEELREALSKLVKFDVDETRKRFWAWLVEHGYATAEYAPHLGHEVVTNVRVPDLATGEPSEVTKARALRDAIHGSLQSLQSMYGPERIAGKRWFEALSELADALKVFLPFARVRVAEDGFFAGKMVSPEKNPIPPHTLSVVSCAESLAALAKKAQENITEYKDDPLPGLKAKKPHLGFLAALEARLSLAGFTYLEIADLVPDGASTDEARKVAAQVDETARPSLAARFRLAHADRIRKRAAPERASIEHHRLQEALTSEWMDRFEAWTGRPVAGNGFREWLESLEHRECEAAIAALDESPTTGE